MILLQNGRQIITKMIARILVAEWRYKMGCHVEICYLDDFSLWNW
jgi:hypothetical protein